MIKSEKIIELKSKIQELREELKQLKNEKLTQKEYKYKSSKIKGKIKCLNDELNCMTHFREYNKARSILKQFGGYYFTWWDSPKNIFRITVSHRSNIEMEIKCYNMITGEKHLKVYDIKKKYDNKSVAIILAEMMIKCINDEKSIKVI